MGVVLEEGATQEMFEFHRIAKASDKRNPYYRRAPDGTIKHLTRINGDNIKEAVGGRPGESQVNLGATLTSEHRH